MQYSIHPERQYLPQEVKVVQDWIQLNTDNNWNQFFEYRESSVTSFFDITILQEQDDLFEFKNRFETRQNHFYILLYTPSFVSYLETTKTTLFTSPSIQNILLLVPFKKENLFSSIHTLIHNYSQLLLLKNFLETQQIAKTRNQLISLFLASQIEIPSNIIEIVNRLSF